MEYGLEQSILDYLLEVSECQVYSGVDRHSDTIYSVLRTSYSYPREQKTHVARNVDHVLGGDIFFFSTPSMQNIQNTLYVCMYVLFLYCIPYTPEYSVFCTEYSVVENTCGSSGLLLPMSVRPSSITVLFFCLTCWSRKELLELYNQCHAPS